MAAPETTLAAVLHAVCPRVYPDANTADKPETPYIVWTQVGGQVIDTVTDPADLHHARIQLAAWAPRRIDAGCPARAGIGPRLDRPCTWRARLPRTRGDRPTL